MFSYVPTYKIKGGWAIILFLLVSNYTKHH